MAIAPRSRVAVLAALALALVAWLGVRRCGSEPATASDHAISGGRPAAAPAAGGAAAGRVAPGSASRVANVDHRVAPATDPARSRPGLATAVRDASRPLRAGEPARDARALGFDDRGAVYDGGVVDRRGRDDGLAAQLNREFMPLVDECVELARVRNPALRGTLILQLQLAPGDQDRVLVAAATRRDDSTVVDPELVECVRESSFSLEGLDSPYDFDLSLPIGEP